MNGLMDGTSSSLHHILTIVQIRILQTCAFLFRYKHNLLASTCTIAGYFNFGLAYYTRTASNYKTIFANMNTRKFSMKVSGLTVWNTLPADILNVSHFHLFKKTFAYFK